MKNDYEGKVFLTRDGREAVVIAHGLEASDKTALIRISHSLRLMYERDGGLYVYASGDFYYDIPDLTKPITTEAEKLYAWDVMDSRGQIHRTPCYYTEAEVRQHYPASQGYKLWRRAEYKWGGE